MAGIVRSDSTVPAIEVTGVCNRRGAVVQLWKGDTAALHAQSPDVLVHLCGDMGRAVSPGLDRLLDKIRKGG